MHIKVDTKTQKARKKDISTEKYRKDIRSSFGGESGFGKICI